MNLSNYKQLAATGKHTLLLTIKKCDDMIAFCKEEKIGFSHWSEEKNIAQLRLKYIETIEAKINAKCN